MAGLPSSPAPDDHSQEARAAIARLLKAACSRLKRVERKLGKLRDDLAACEEAADLRQQGELLKAHLGRLTRGMDRAEVPDYYHPGQTRSIPLDPARPPKETVSRLFKKAAKLERGAERIPDEINRAEEERDALQAFADAAPEALALPEGTALPLAELEEQARRCNLQTKHSAPSEKRQQRPGKAEALRKSIRVFTSRDGVELLVGKSNTDNDTLTFRIARGNDWWFHLAPAAGSHVVARWSDSGDLPQETLVDAGHLALHFSKMRGAAHADIHYTRAKHIRRIRGAPPGKVRLEQHRTLRLRVEEERLDRLLQRH